MFSAQALISVCCDDSGQNMFAIRRCSRRSGRPRRVTQVEVMRAYKDEYNHEQCSYSKASPYLLDSPDLLEDTSNNYPRTNYTKFLLPDMPKCFSQELMYIPTNGTTEKVQRKSPTYNEDDLHDDYPHPIKRNTTSSHTPKHTSTTRSHKARYSSDYPLSYENEYGSSRETRHSGAYAIPYESTDYPEPYTQSRTPTFSYDDFASYEALRGHELTNNQRKVVKLRSRATGMYFDIAIEAAKKVFKDDYFNCRIVADGRGLCSAGIWRGNVKDALKVDEDRDLRTSFMMSGMYRLPEDAAENLLNVVQDQLREWPGYQNLR